MVYKLLAVKIDGALLQSNGRISRATKEAIEYVQSKGVAVVLVTSLNYQFSKKVAKSLKGQIMIVTANGAFVGTSINKPLLVKKIAEKTTMDIIKLLEGIDCRFKVHFEEFEVAQRVDVPENMLGKAIMYVNESKAYTQHYVDSVSEYLQENPNTPLSIEVTFKSQKEQKDIKHALNNMFSDLTITEMDDCVSIIGAEQISKWKGILYLAEYLKVAKKEIVTIGVSKHDLEMIVGAGMGIAMGNSDKELKRRAKWIARSNDDDGVAFTVKELFRKQYQLQFLEKMNLLK